MLAIVAGLATPAALAGVVNSFADITNWTGSGANRAALVIDWADGQDALVWGYRFDTAKSADLVRAVVEADSRLYAKVEQFGFGQFIHGLGYDRNSAGFSISSGSNFGASGFLLSGARNGATATDPADSYRETNTSFTESWGFWFATGENYPAGAWTESGVGISDRQLVNSSWDGFRFNSTTGPGTAVAAVPEPSGLALTGLIAGSVMALRRKRRVAAGQRWGWLDRMEWR